MIINYLKTTLRQHVRYRNSSLINIAGLAFGLACSIISYIHITHENSFDEFHTNKRRIYRIVTGDPATGDYWVKAPAPLSPVIKERIPEVETVVRFSSVTFNEKVMVEANNRRFMEPYFMMADPDFFHLFSYPFIKGDKSTALSDNNSVVVSESVAQKLFGKEDPIGRVVRLTDNNLDFQVTGVMKDFPENTHLRADYIINFENTDRTFGAGRLQQWNAYNYWAYVMLNPIANANEAQRKIQAMKVDLPGNEVASTQEFFLQPMLDIHFQHNPGNLVPAYNKNYIYLFMALAFAVFVIAGMNYFNLATMISLRRIKEIGVRKAIGASSRQLVVQFIVESILVALTGLVLAVLLLVLMSPMLSNFMGIHFNIKYTDPTLYIFMLGMVVLLGAASGSYLALFVNSFKPSSILKGTVGRSTKGIGVQHALIFAQFSISITLIISSLIITGQMRHLFNKDLGFDQDHVVNITMSKDMEASQLEVLKSQLRNSSHVSAVASSDFVPGEPNFNQTVWWEGQVEAESMNIIVIDKDFIPAMKLELVEGSLEQILNSTDRQYVLNESAARRIGWETSVSKWLSPFGESRKKPVSGVVKDFNFRSLHNVIDPLVLVIYPNDRTLSALSVRLEKGDLQESLTEVERIYTSVTQELPFEYAFLDESIQTLYKAESRVSKLVLFLAFVALTFALLGIYSLISFSIENRAKEVAVRKILGITPRELILLFSRSYLSLALAASLLMLPVCWNILGTWLDQFAYRADLSPALFVISVLLLIGSVILIGVIKYTSLSQINPAQTLKCE